MGEARKAGLARVPDPDRPRQSPPELALQHGGPCVVIVEIERLGGASADREHTHDTRRRQGTASESGSIDGEMALRIFDTRHDTLLRTEDGRARWRMQDMANVGRGGDYQTQNALRSADRDEQGDARDGDLIAPCAPQRKSSDESDCEGQECPGDAAPTPRPVRHAETNRIVPELPRPGVMWSGSARRFEHRARLLATPCALERDDD